MKVIHYKSKVYSGGDLDILINNNEALQTFLMHTKVVYCVEHMAVDQFEPNKVKTYILFNTKCDYDIYKSLIV